MNAEVRVTPRKLIRGYIPHPLGAKGEVAAYSACSCIVGAPERTKPHNFMLWGFVGVWVRE